MCTRMALIEYMLQMMIVIHDMDDDHHCEKQIQLCMHFISRLLKLRARCMTSLCAHKHRDMSGVCSKSYSLLNYVYVCTPTANRRWL